MLLEGKLYASLSILAPSVAEESGAGALAVLSLSLSLSTGGGGGAWVRATGGLVGGALTVAGRLETFIFVITYFNTC